ncbi:hypothetical protein HOLleu_15399 [Holothuria leucospilota]|uniref:Peptidase aspartic putative domain-containing protein n=1 Tax=Holothuria leucospilota TaxID=206669 RepID=A0A9Q1CA57_HOLLE|nr:hypothetical protein HOLleu_15399 [Holothuria leucospilota]
MEKNEEKVALYEKSNKDFSNAHEEFVSKLEEKQDTEENKNYFQPKFEEYQQFSKEISDWMKGMEEDVKPQDSISQVSSNTSEASRASSVRSKASTARMKEKAKLAELRAKAELIKIKRELEEHERRKLRKGTNGCGLSLESSRLQGAFIAAFEHNIEKFTENDQDRLYYLQQYTSGRPRELVRSCMGKDRNRGYDQARKELEEEYGGDFKILNSYRKEIEMMKSLKGDDTTAMKDYLTFCVAYSNVMKESDILRKMDQAESIMKLVCRKLGAKSHEQKLAFLRSKGFRFRCLEGNHVSKDCKQDRLICETYKKPHPTVLHYNRKPEQKSPKNSSEEQTSKETVKQVKVNCTSTQIHESSICMGVGVSKTSLSIVPVRVKSKSTNKDVETYAFLDNGSTDTFISEDLARQLSVSGPKTKIMLSTLQQEGLMDSRAITNLEVCDVEGHITLLLPKLFTKKRLPVCKDDIVTQEDLKKWPYLSSLTTKC